jgi:hypothetical protein
MHDGGQGESLVFPYTHGSVSLLKCMSMTWQVISARPYLAHRVLTQGTAVHKASKVSSWAVCVRRPPPRASRHSRYDGACAEIVDPVETLSSLSEVSSATVSTRRPPPPRLSPHIAAVMSARPGALSMGPRSCSAQEAAAEEKDGSEEEEEYAARRRASAPTHLP